MRSGDISVIVVIPSVVVVMASAAVVANERAVKRAVEHAKPTSGE